ncbi:MAG: hypothetical protein F6K18_05300 [Okeania sp. SIO2C2]|uniref:hypothetical protein n=1 Tax=Okeania sp. SIO2C2 TaxID=2607787 RepID=UPI0013B986F0|nr:hypothetical protein [Okeania sp. SIO2C2]NEP86284.1 hypothetical protein [Okeania sp. SIO2C2]
MKNNNKQPNNRLFALGQGILVNKTSEQKSHQPSPKKRKRTREEARAFDFGKVIQLQYDGDAFPSATPEVRSFSNSKSFASELEDESLPFEVEVRAFDFGEAIQLQHDTDDLPTATPEVRSFSNSKSFASELEDESLPFEVEAFEVDKEVTPVSKSITPQSETPVQPVVEQEVTPKPIEVQSVQVNEEVTSNLTEVQPVKATVVSPSEMPLKSTRPVKQSTRVEENLSKEELSDAQAFAEDLQAILNGEKTYDAEQKQVVPTSPPAKLEAAPAPTSHPHDIFDQGQAATPTPPQQQAEPEPVPMSRSHAVFDQMGKNMAHTTDFDQGTVDLALEMRFDEFDRLLDRKVQQMTVPEPTPNEHNVEKVQEETLEAKEISVPLELEASEPQGDRDLMPQVLATPKSPTTGKTASSLKDNEVLIPVDAWF